MPVFGVLAQAHIGDHEQLRVSPLDRGRRQLHDALLIPCPGAVLVLLRRHPEQHHGGYPQRGELLGLCEDLGDRQALDARHRSDRLTRRTRLGDEQRQHEPAGAQLGLSRTNPRRGADARSLRMRVCGNDMVLSG